MSSSGAALGKEPGPGPRWQGGVSYPSPVVRAGVCPGHTGQAAVPGEMTSSPVPVAPWTLCTV